MHAARSSLKLHAASLRSIYVIQNFTALGFRTTIFGHTQISCRLLPHIALHLLQGKRHIRVSTSSVNSMAGAPGQETRNRSMPDNKYGELFANHALYDYLLTHSYRPNVHLDELHQVTMKQRRAGMCSPPDSIPLLQVLVQLVNAKKIIEVGVFTGYTSLGMALALPEGGKIYACDISEEYPAVGKPFWEAAGVKDKIDLRIAPASKTMDNFLQSGEEGTFDMAFIDADKSGYNTYYEQLLKLLRPGGVIVVDNVLWDGSVIRPEIQDPDTVAIRAINDKIFKDDRVTMCMLPVSDGVTIALKK